MLVYLRVCFTSQLVLLRRRPVRRDTTNVAARLQAAARPGGILIGQATYDAVRDEVAVEPFGELDLKGKLAPVPTYEVRVDRTASA
jgi:class 3 adenylate cyclase